MLTYINSFTTVSTFIINVLKVLELNNCCHKFYIPPNVQINIFKKVKMRYRVLHTDIT